MRFRGVFTSSCYCTSFFEVMSLRRIDWCVFAEVMLLYVLFFEVMSPYYIDRAVFSENMFSCVSLKSCWRAVSTMAFRDERTRVLSRAPLARCEFGGVPVLTTNTAQN